MSFVSNLLRSSQPDVAGATWAEGSSASSTKTHPSKRPEDFALWTATPG